MECQYAKPLPSFLRVRAAEGLEKELCAFDPNCVLAFNTGEERWQIWTLGKVSHNWIRVLSWENDEGVMAPPDARMIEVLHRARLDKTPSPQVYVQAKMAMDADIERKRRAAALDEDRHLIKENIRGIVKDCEEIGTKHYQTRKDRRLIMANFDRECEARGDGV